MRERGFRRQIGLVHSVYCIYGRAFTPWSLQEGEIIVWRCPDLEERRVSELRRRCARALVSIGLGGAFQQSCEACERREG